METDPPRRIRLAIADPLQARLAADAIRAFGVATIETDAAADVVHTVATILPGRPGRIRLGHFLMQVKAGMSAPEPMLRFGPYRLDAKRAVLERGDGDVIMLTEKERDVLARLHRENGGILDRKTLLDEVWGYADSVETHTLETHIYRLRRKIEDDPGAPRWLLTEEPGYRLADVS